MWYRNEHGDYVEGHWSDLPDRYDETWDDVEECGCGAIIGVVLGLCDACHQKRLRSLSQISDDKRQHILRRQLKDNDTALDVMMGNHYLQIELKEAAK